MNISDIAKIAKVSKSAVSIALNNKPGISDETRKHILEIIKKTGYKHKSMVNLEALDASNKLIRLLAYNKTDLVSLQYTTSSFFNELIHSLERYSRERGYALIFSSVNKNDGDLKQTVEKMESEHRSKGIVLLGTNLDMEEIKAIKEVQNNTVVIDTCFDFMEMDFIVMDNTSGAYRAAEYLISLGHRHIGYVQSSSRLVNFEARKHGFFAAMDRHGVKLGKNDIFSTSSDMEEAKLQFLQQLSEKNRSELPSALFCECDYIAIGVIKALQESGIRVPDDISVMGFDNVQEATVISPELTTINVQKDKIGQLAIERLCEIIEKKDTSKIKLILDTQLIVRKSCRPYDQ